MTADIQSSRGIKGIKSRISHLENTWVHAYWYESVGAGTSGTLAPPSGGVIELDRFASGVDALASTITGGEVDWKSPVTAGGVVIAATLDGSGNWTITGTPSAYPVAVIYAYRVKLKDFDLDYSIGEVEIEPAHNALIGLQGGTTDQYYHFNSSEHTELTAWLPHVVLSGTDGSVTSDGSLTAAKIVDLPNAYYPITSVLADWTSYLKVGPTVYLHENSQNPGQLMLKSDGATTMGFRVQNPTGSALAFFDHGTGFGGGFYVLKNGITEFSFSTDAGGNGTLWGRTQDRDIIFKGNDGGVAKELFRLDSSAAAVKVPQGLLYIGADCALYRLSSNLLALASGDSFRIVSGDLLLSNDGSKILLGTSSNASITYSTNMIIDPKEVGSGILDVLGTVRTQGRIPNINTSAKTANYTILSTDEIIVNNTSGGAFWNKLPAAPEDGETHTIILETAGNDLTVDGNGKNINGSATILVGSAGSSMQLVYNGTQWNIK